MVMKQKLRLTNCECRCLRQHVFTQQHVTANSIVQYINGVLTDRLSSYDAVAQLVPIISKMVRYFLVIPSANAGGHYKCIIIIGS